jgi:hypothetical protein
MAGEAGETGDTSGAIPRQQNSQSVPDSATSGFQLMQALIVSYQSSVLSCSVDVA